MSEKVKLPKAVCDALNIARGYNIDTKGIIAKWNERRWFDPYFEPIWKYNLEIVKKALTVGYEPEPTPEEKIKELYDFQCSQKLFDDYYEGIFKGYKRGVSDALRIHGIHYDWLDGDTE